VARNVNVESWKQRAKQLKAETYALYLAYKDPRVPWFAKVLLALLVGYVFSPIDPIPDFIPIVGLLDELVVVPLGVMAVRKMVPDEVLLECRERAQEATREGKPVNRVAAVVIVAIWLVLAVLAALIVMRVLREFTFGR
jgi:uncharacterized membrane protein YkvA (DUF1232 family)